MVRIWLILFALIAMLSAPFATPAFALTASWRPYDTDNDGTIDLNELKTAAGAAFDKLDKAKTGRLTVAELRGRLSAGEIREADTENDRTKPRSVSKDDYLAVIEKFFNSADRAHNGKLDTKELSSSPGKRLLILIR